MQLAMTRIPRTFPIARAFECDAETYRESFSGILFEVVANAISIGDMEWACNTARCYFGAPMPVESWRECIHCLANELEAVQS